MVKSINKKIIEMTKSFLCDEKGQISTMYMVFFASIIILAIIIVFTFIPGIGSTVERATPSIPAYGNTGGDWNASDTNNTNSVALKAAQGSAIWASTSGILLVAIIIGVVVIILAALFGIFQARKGEGGGGGGM